MGRSSCFCWTQGAVQTRYDDYEACHQPQGVREYPAQTVYEPAKQIGDKNDGHVRQQAVFLVKMASTSDGLPSLSGGGTDSSDGTSTGRSCPSDIFEDDIWYDCDEQEWFDAQDAQDAGQQQQQGLAGCSTGDQPALRLTAEQAACLRALPSQLSSLLTTYLRGTSLGCKPTVALMKYMQDSHTSLAELQALLQPLLAAERHLPQLLPVASARMSPEQLTATLHHKQQAARAGSSIAGSAHTSSSTGPTQPQACLGHLLHNLQLAHNTLEMLAQEAGFKQVASGALKLWYFHDMVNKRQIIRSRVVLDEPVSVIAAVTREFDLVKSWNPGMADMCELASYSPTELLVYMLMYMPWPLHMPEVINYCFGLDLLDLMDPCVLFQTSSVQAPPGIEIPKHPRTIPLNLTVGGFKLVPLPALPERPDTPRTEVTVLVSIDAASFVVPDSIVSFVLKVFAPLVYKSVLHVLKRMFHTAGAAGGQAHSSAGDTAAPLSRSAPSATTCSGSMLVERLGLRPEYGALDARTRQLLAAQAAAAETVEPLDLTTPRTTGAGVATAT